MPFRGSNAGCCTWTGLPASCKIALLGVLVVLGLAGCQVNFIPQYERPPRGLISPARTQLDRPYAVLGVPHKGLPLDQLHYQQSYDTGARIAVPVGRFLVDAGSDWWSTVVPETTFLNATADGTPPQSFDKERYAGWLLLELQSFDFQYDPRVGANIGLAFVPFGLGVKAMRGRVRCKATIVLRAVDARSGRSLAEFTATGVADPVPCDPRADSLERLKSWYEQMDSNMRESVIRALTDACSEIDRQLGGGEAANRPKVNDCPVCEAKNRLSSKFCESCGNELAAGRQQRCPGCGAEVPESARFCGGCGAEVPFLGEAKYQEAMAEGNAMAAKQDWTKALAAYEKALQLKRGDAAAKAGIGKAESQVKFELVLDEAKGIRMEFVRIKAGTFTMGSEDGESDEKPAREVTISSGFWMGKTEVTQAQWAAVVGEKPSMFKGDAFPVEQVSWEDIHQKFLARLKTSGKVASLPTEAEWEYACRAGSKSVYGFGDEAETLGGFGWFWENSGKQSHEVGQRAANAWGLYDMHGNVSEWCEDWYAVYEGGAQTDPRGPATGTARVIRGGSWASTSQNCRSSDRDRDDPALRKRRWESYGFRVVLR